MSYPLANSTTCALQGGQYLRMSSTLSVTDTYGNPLHSFPLADFGAIADQGEFGFNFLLSSSNPYMIFDENLTGFSGATSDTDVDFFYLSCSSPVLVELAYGIPLNSVAPGSRNPSGMVFDVASCLLWKTNTISGLTLDVAADQRCLPMRVVLPSNIASSQCTLYFAKFSN
jgi:hypothetical protein